MLGLYRKWFPELRQHEPTLENYEAAIDQLLTTLAARSPRARAAVITLPPLSEDLADPVNARVQQYNASLARIVARHGGTARLVDFHAACVRYLEEQPGGRGGKPYALLSWFGLVRYQFTAAPLRQVLRLSYDTISRVNGMRLLTDQVHLNDKAGALLLELLQPFVDELV